MERAVVLRELRPSSGGGRTPISTILSRYILKEIAVPAVLAVAIIGFIGVANEMRERREAMELEFITLWDVARLAFYLSPTLVAYIIPITFMLGILLAFGRLAQNNEITAMKAAGISLKRLVAPVILFGAILSGLSFCLQDRVQPAAMQHMNHLLYTELPQRITLEMLPTGVMHDVSGWRVYIGSRDAATKTLKDVVILQPKDGQNWVYYGESAQFIEDASGLKVNMPKGNIVLPQGNDSVTSMPFTNLSVSLPSKSLRPPPSLRKSMALRELWEREAQARKQYEVSKSKSTQDDLRKVRTEICERFSLPLACLAVSVIAAPFAVRAPRAGRSHGFAVGFIILLVYYALRMVLEPSTVKPFAEMLLRALTPNIVLGLAGVIAIWRVDRV
ncbi:MAG: LptF/LptG family permease [Candidatus Hydrogenedentes bacterium]|nr:LptF/LptG family permease [Candidatus Hydrogenedentota bacterium]